jgi:nucleotide-binding universal stress UspA family protein
LSIARDFAAHLQFLHTRLDAADLVVALGSDVGGGLLAADLIESFEAEAARGAAQVQEKVRAFCKREGVALDEAVPVRAGVTASWHRETGREADLIAEYCRGCDLIVTGRADTDDVLAAALLETGRPVLVAGADLDINGAIAIAWKSTREAARAVAGAMPLLARAKRIVILTAAESGRSDSDSSRRLALNLTRHGFVVEMREVDGSPPAEALLGAASAAGAGLLVMGGYGHSRLREMIFGGVTEHMVHKAAMPVLIAH